MNQITYNGNIYNIHPTYDLYASNKDGHIICINRNVTPIKIHKHKHKNRFYFYFNAERQDSPFAIPITVHRFVWECFNGFIPENGVIKHINDKRNNSISNLQFVSQTDIEYYNLETDFETDIVYYKFENDVIEEILKKEGYSKFINDLIEDKFMNDLIKGIVIEI